MLSFSQESPKTPSLPAARDVAPALRVRRFTFTDDTSTGAGGRRFTQPRRAAALEEEVSLASVGMASDRPEPLDPCFIVCVPEGASNQSRERARALLASPGRPEAPQVMTVEHNSDVLEWRPGFAVVQCRENVRNDIVAALVDFAFYEGNLRALEQSIDAAEAPAEADVALAHRMRYRNRAHWERLADCSENCARLRLRFARLEPQLGSPSRSLSPAARVWMSRLIQRADMESRLEALSDRLEALEELYEGAAQRISEYRWYVSGHALEIGIIVLLVLECTLMSADLYFRHRGSQLPQELPPAAQVLTAG